MPASAGELANREQQAKRKDEPENYQRGEDRELVHCILRILEPGPVAIKDLWAGSDSVLSVYERAMRSKFVRIPIFMGWHGAAPDAGYGIAPTNPGNEWGVYPMPMRIKPPARGGRRW